MEDIQQAEAEQQPIFEGIATNGDVIFQVGNGEDQRCLLVNSVVLEHASTLFKTWFGPAFEGRHERNADNPRTIVLGDDEPQGMSDLCHLLHLRRVRALEKNVDLDRLVSFAIVVDKYCCTDAVMLSAKSILQDLLAPLRKSSPEERLLEPSRLYNLLAAAYLLDQRECFKRATAAVIKHYNGNMSEMRETASRKVLPTEVLLYLGELRLSIRNQAVLRCYDLNDSPSFERCEQCDEQDQERYDEHIMEIYKAECPLVLGNVTPGGCCDALSKAKTFSYDQESRHCHRYGLAPSVSKLRFHELAKTVESWCDRGLCLRCVREDCVDISLENECTDPKHRY